MLVGCSDSRETVDPWSGPGVTPAQARGIEVTGFGAVPPATAAVQARGQGPDPSGGTASRHVGPGPSDVPDITAERTTGRASLDSVAGRSGPHEVVFRSRVSPWGVAPSHELSWYPAGWIDEMATAGVTAVRGFRPGPDGRIRADLLDAGVDLTGVLSWTPPGEPEQTLPVSDLPGWRAYVTDQVTRYRHAVSRWEVWNEPPNFTADKSPESYAAVVAAAHDAAKAVDPAVQVGIAAKSTHLHYLAAAMDAGAAGHFDFLTIHPYEMAEKLEYGIEGPFLRMVGNIRTMLEQKSPDRKDVPIHLTEVGLQVDDGGNGGVTPEFQADGLVMIYTLGYAQGIDRIHWFDPRDSETLEHGLLDRSGRARPAYNAYRALTTWLGERPSYHGWLAPENGVHGHVFSGPHGTVLSAWTEIGAGATSLSFDSDVQVVDPHDGGIDVTRTVELGRKPVLVVADPASPAEVQIHADVRSKGLPNWHGHDPRDGVRMEAGRRPQGIALLGEHALVERYGVDEIDVSRGGPGLSFAVDPGFVGWTPEPIEVTAVVRGHGTGRPGLNLKYEAARHPSDADGFNMVGASPGWRDVSGTEPVTLTWVLEDPRFVGKYGTSLRLDSDSRAHADWSLLRLSMRRLDDRDPAR